MTQVFDTEFRDILGAEFVSVVGGLATGAILAIQEDVVLAVPGLLIIFPGFLELRGNISGSLAARIAAGLYLGELTAGDWRHRLVVGNLVGSFVLVIVVCGVLGGLAYAYTVFIFGINATQLLVIPLLAGVLANLIEIPLTLAATFAVYRRGHDPNDVIGPFVTSTGDVTSVLALFVAVMLV
ncbi:magnesium transporter [Halomarina rubra]|uniref:Magnesium transporter n=1 Tax=Halomarina rubra TaxID=2071873 RepID=A0ABD6AUW2_9EURY|nr:magnesium transporter [Halomarina rubra]